MPYAKTLARLMLIGLALVMTACSQDKGKYYSTPYQPINYEVIDPGNGEILWRTCGCVRAGSMQF